MPHSNSLSNKTWSTWSKALDASNKHAL